jgi:hypothetical protein
MPIIFLCVCRSKLWSCLIRAVYVLQPQAHPDKQDVMLDYMRTSLVTFETAFLASSMKFHPVHISLLYYILVAILKIPRGGGWWGGSVWGGG